MLKKTMTYTDYDGVERTEDVYFNLSKAELIEMQISTDGGYDKMIERIINSKDMKSMGEIFRDLLRKSYGIKSDDGRRFMKSEEISDTFEQSPIYSDIYMELLTNPDEAAKFVQAIMPSDLQKDIAKAIADNSAPNLTPVD